MVLLNVFFTWMASLCICFLTARAFMGSGQPGLLMFGCGSLLWGVTSLAAAVIVDRVNATITVHNLGVLGAALCHLAGSFWRGRLPRPGRWLLAGYAGTLVAAALIFRAATAEWTPVFFVQGHGGTPIREVVLLLATALFAWVAWQMISRFRRQSGAFYYWYGLGLALVATGLIGVMLLSVQGGILGWTNRLTQYLGSAYLFVAALMAARETGKWTFSLSAVDGALQEYWFTGDRRLASIVESSSDAILSKTLDGIIRSWNAGAEKIYGYTANEVVGKAVSLLVPPGHPDEVPQILERIARGERIAHYETVRVRKDGEQIPVALTVSPIFDAHGRIVGASAIARDITEQKRAEAALRESREKLTLALRSACMGVWRLDLRDQQRHFDDQVCRCLGIDPARFAETEEEFFAAVHPDDRQELRDAMTQTLASGAPYEVEYRTVWPDGSLHFIAARGQVSRDAAGRPQWIDGLVWDITERKQAEAERQKFVSLADQSTEFIGMCDMEYRPFYVNEAGRRLVGLESLEQACRTPVPDFFFPEDQQFITEEFFPRVLREGQAEVEIRFRHFRTGEALWMIYNVFYIHDIAGQPVGLATVSRNITERKRAEEQLRLLSTALDAAVNGIAITDRQGTLQWVNPAFTQLTGYSRAEAFGQNPRVLKSGRHPPEFYQAMWETLLRSEPWHGQLVNRRKDGTLYDEEMTITPVRAGGGAITHFVAIKQDVSNRKRAEEALVQAKAAAEAASVAKSQFLANMSHELRTPMNAILGMIDVALPKATDPTVQDCLQTARGSADLLLTLLNDLLDSAKIESGKLELESAPFSLRRMLDQITRVLAVRASEKGLCFYCRMPDETPDAVVGDRMRLQQVLLNLAGNAVKFTERGDIEISLDALSQDGDACLEFAVRDTGIGIPPSGLERLFQPFTQADASMARRFGGTGLGLSISKTLVEMMGGRIWGESEQGKGSTFYFTVRLPLAKELPSGFEASVDVPAAACAQLCILLVEDNPANQKLAAYLLKDRGHLVEIAGDGQEAVYLSEKNRYDVILMDVQMPGMNGLEATAAIRKRDDGGRRVPIIAMTAHAMKGDREQCLAVGMDGYLSKPINGRELIGLAETLAAGVPFTAADAGSSPLAPPQLATEDRQGQEPRCRAAVIGIRQPKTVDELATVNRAIHKVRTPATPAVVFDLELALSRCSDSQDLVREMARCFFDDVDKLLPQMRAALETGDLVEVGRLGHRLKGTVVYLGAKPAEEAALSVERCDRSSDGTPPEPAEAVNALERECLALQAALREFSLAAEPKQDGYRTSACARPKPPDVRGK